MYDAYMRHLTPVIKQVASLDQGLGIPGARPRAPGLARGPRAPAGPARRPLFGRALMNIPHTYIYVYTPYMQTCMFVCMYIYIYTRARVCVCVSLCVCVRGHVHVHVHVHVRVHLHVHVYIYIYIYI